MRPTAIVVGAAASGVAWWIWPLIGVFPLWLLAVTAVVAVGLAVASGVLVSPVAAGLTWLVAAGVPWPVDGPARLVAAVALGVGLMVAFRDAPDDTGLGDE